MGVEARCGATPVFGHGLVVSGWRLRGGRSARDARCPRAVSAPTPAGCLFLSSPTNVARRLSLGGHAAGCGLHAPPRLPWRPLPHSVSTLFLPCLSGSLSLSLSPPAPPPRPTQHHVYPPPFPRARAALSPSTTMSVRPTRPPPWRTRTPSSPPPPRATGRAALRSAPATFAARPPRGGRSFAAMACASSGSRFFSFFPSSWWVGGGGLGRCLVYLFLLLWSLWWALFFVVVVEAHTQEEWKGGGVAPGDKRWLPPYPT